MRPVLVVDNLSPFTPDIVACLGRLGISHERLEYSQVSPADLARYDRVILSGRRKNDPVINAANSKIIKSCHDTGQPLLGICYGSEIIALTLGGSLKKMARHVQGPITIQPRKNPLTDGKSQITVYESHGYCVARIPPGFEPLASSQDCQYEMFAHKSKKIFGTQFHPEKSGADGMDIISNFVRV
ncbi:type 1 glutamine amidotransferase [Nitrososphaera sp.]|uniref:type 1 glutamine amidotransferase n=1 Tax=Nitrososphaera sp. TaxID=1971748 RepID=UPI0017B42242|nr:gamma-glutamyl-gamma-aminobutyrate hydrolase family protein [Nitrososphaera sp.]NWG37199.1 gamma-glutamyl-gamma-aminobutyrate hydrolase family protein [Nitrososphaera sp.]